LGELTNLCARALSLPPPRMSADVAALEVAGGGVISAVSAAGLGAEIARVAGGYYTSGGEVVLQMPVQLIQMPVQPEGLEGISSRLEETSAISYGGEEFLVSRDPDAARIAAELAGGVDDPVAVNFTVLSLDGGTLESGGLQFNWRGLGSGDLLGSLGGLTIGSDGGGLSTASWVVSVVADLSLGYDVVVGYFTEELAAELQYRFDGELFPGVPQSADAVVVVDVPVLREIPSGGESIQYETAFDRRESGHQVRLTWVPGEPGWIAYTMTLVEGVDSGRVEYRCAGRLPVEVGRRGMARITLTGHRNNSTTWGLWSSDENRRRDLMIVAEVKKIRPWMREKE